MFNILACPSCASSFTNDAAGKSILLLLVVIVFVLAIFGYGILRICMRQKKHQLADEFRDPYDL